MYDEYTVLDTVVTYKLSKRIYMLYRWDTHESETEKSYVVYLLTGHAAVGARRVACTVRFTVVERALILYYYGLY